MTSDRVILGEDIIYSTDCDVTGINGNVIVCGGSGCGKTMSISEPKFLETLNSNLIATVTKRRIVDKYKPLFVQRGYQVEELNFIVPEKSTISYDPMQYVHTHSDIRFLAESIVKGDKDEHKSVADPYWNDAAISLLSAEIAMLMETKKKPSFADVLSFHEKITYGSSNDLTSTNVDAMFEKLAMEKPNSYAVSCWKSFRGVPIKTAGCIFGTLNVRLDTIFTPELRKMISMKKKVNFEKLASQKSVLFISTSPVNPALNSFVNMFYAQAFKSLFEYAENQPNGKLPIPMHMLCDDFATGGRILNFPEYISIIREKLISVTLLIQSESQLESIYGNSYTSIVNNCDTYVYMGSMDYQTANIVSKKLNVPVEEVLYMPIGQLYIFRRGQKPITTSRYNIRNNPLYQEITAVYEESISHEK